MQWECKVVHCAAAAALVLRCHYVRHYRQRHGSCTRAVSELLLQGLVLVPHSACSAASTTVHTKASGSPDDDTSQTDPSRYHILQ